METECREQGEALRDNGGWDGSCWRSHQRLCEVTGKMLDVFIALKRRMDDIVTQGKCNQLRKRGDKVAADDAAATACVNGSVQLGVRRERQRQLHMGRCFGGSDQLISVSGQGEWRSSHTYCRQSGKTKV